MDSRDIDKIVTGGVKFGAGVAGGIVLRYLFGFLIMIVLGYVQYTYYPKYTEYHEFWNAKNGYLQYANDPPKTMFDKEPAPKPAHEEVEDKMRVEPASREEWTPELAAKCARVDPRDRKAKSACIEARAGKSFDDLDDAATVRLALSMRDDAAREKFLSEQQAWKKAVEKSCAASSYREKTGEDMGDAMELCLMRESEKRREEISVR